MFRKRLAPTQLHNRRTFLGAAGALALTGATSVGIRTGGSQAAYPSRPVRLLVGFGAGGSSDIIARVAGAKIGEILGQQFVVENCAGAGGVVATQAVARAPNDGYTLLLTAFSDVVNESLIKDLPYVFTRDFAPIGTLAETGLVLIVHPTLEVRSVADLIAMAKEKPGNILYATAGRGTATHLAGELFNVMAGTQLTPVHYKSGAETVRDLLTGEVKMMFSTLPPVLEFVKQGKMRSIATTGRKRDFALPELPTIAESGLPGFDMVLWFGISAPVGTQRDIIERVNAATRQALAAADVKTAMARQGYETRPGTPEEFSVFLTAEIEKWRKVVQAIPSLAN